MPPRLSHLLLWYLNLFDPPPLESMNFRQKVGRIVLVTIALVISCILGAMLLTMLLFIEETGRSMVMSVPHLLKGLIIIFFGLLVNAVCVIVLLAIHRADTGLIPPKPNAEKPKEVTTA